MTDETKPTVVPPDGADGSGKPAGDPAPDPNLLHDDINKATGDGSKPNSPKTWKTIDEVPEEFRALIRPLLSKSFEEGKRRATKVDQTPDGQGDPPKGDSVSATELKQLLEETRNQILAEMGRAQAEQGLRHAATARLQKILSSEGILPESPQHKALLDFYAKEKAAGRLDGRALMTEAGIRSLIMASGAKLLDEGVSPGGSRDVARLGNEGFGPLSKSERQAAAAGINTVQAVEEMERKLAILKK